MKDKELAKQTELDGHLEQPWNYAHKIWENIKTKLPYWKRDVVNFTPAGGYAWQTVTVTNAPANATVILFLTIHVEQNADDDWIVFRVRKNGSSDWEGEAGGVCRGPAAGGYPDFAGMLQVELDADKKYQYYCDWSGLTTRTVRHIGMMVFPR
jgi:hypothetical protein